MSEPLLEARNVSYYYPGDSVGVEDVNLSLNRGESIAVIGPTGAGKSTLLHVLAGLLKPQRGVVVRRGKTAILMQEYSNQILYPTVRQELLYTAYSLGEEPNAFIERVTKEFKLEGLLDRYTFKLSAGEKKRLVIALILSMNPDILLLDEPFTDADSITISILEAYIAKIKSRGTVILASNDITTALELADKALLQVRGRIVKVYNSAQELLDDLGYLESVGIRTPKVLLCKT